MSYPKVLFNADGEVSTVADETEEGYARKSGYIFTQNPKPAATSVVIKDVIAEPDFVEYDGDNFDNVIDRIGTSPLPPYINRDADSKDKKNVKISDDGRFGIRVDLFKKGGGKIESERLNVPLLGELPISQDIMEATDSGKPIIEHEPESQIALLFKEIAEKIARSFKNV